MYQFPALACYQIQNLRLNCYLPFIHVPQPLYAATSVSHHNLVLKNIPSQRSCLRITNSCCQGHPSLALTVTFTETEFDTYAKSDPI